MNTMKIVLLFLLISFSNLNAEVISLLKSKKYYRSSDSPNWNLKGQEYFFYNNRGKLIETVGIGSIFDDTKCEGWWLVDTEILIDTINTYDYYEDGSLKEHFSRNLKYPFGVDTRRTYHYNSGKISEVVIIEKQMNKTDSSIYRYSYNPRGNTLIEIYKQAFISNFWQVAEKYKIVFLDEQVRITKDSLISNYEVNEYKYDKNGNLKLKDFTKLDYSFHLTSTTHYTNNKIDSIMYLDQDYYEEEHNYWLFCYTSWQDRFNYDKDGNLLTELKYFSGALNDRETTGYERVDYEYGDISVDVKTDEFQEIGKLTISPNPATDFLEISYSPSINSMVNHTVDGIAIFNVFGEKVLTSSQYSILSTQYSAKLDVSGLPSGMYLVKVGERFGKFVKM